MECDIKDVTEFIDLELVKYVSARYKSVGTRQAVFLSFIKAIDTLQDQGERESHTDPTD